MNSEISHRIAWIILATTSVLCPQFAQADNLLANGSFAKQKDGVPTDWSIRSNRQKVRIDATGAHHPEVDRALRVDIFTDGGWDDKSANPALIDCVSLRNKRNYRFWSKPGPACPKNCIGAYAVDYRSGKPGIGLWQAAGGYVRAENSTFYTNACAVSVESDGSPTRYELSGCILVGAKDAKLLSVENGGRVSRADTIEGNIGDPETDTRLTAPQPQWKGTTMPSTVADSQSTARDSDEEDETVITFVRENLSWPMERSN